MQTREPTRNYPAGANRSRRSPLHEEIERQCDGCRARAVGGRAGASARLVGRWASTGLASAAKKRSPWLKLGKSGDGHPARRVAMRASHW